MNALFKAWTTSRKLYLSFFENYSLDQLNQIPEGFNNNLIWNIGHIIVAQQSLIYMGSNLPMHISGDLLNLYKPGTKPLRPTSQTEVDELQQLLMTLVDKTRADFQNNLFKEYNERSTVTGFHLSTIQDALEFNNYHEALHMGYMMSIKKFL